MSDFSRTRWWVLAAALVTFMTGLGSTRLWDEDEGWFAATAAEMHRRDEWIVPWHNGQVFTHKPPLMYWGMRLGFATFGVNEWGARIGSALFGTATALLTCWVGCRLFARSVGLWAGLAMATCIMFGVVSRASTADAYLVFFMTLVMAAYIRWTPGFQTNDAVETGLSRWLPARWSGFVAMYAAMGLAVLVKGPIGILLPGTGIGLFVLLQLTRGEVRWLPRGLAIARWIPRVFWEMRPITAIATVVVVAGWWFGAVEARTGSGFIAEFLGVHNVQRFLTPMEKHSGPIVYYIPVVWIGFFPWSLFLIPSVVSVWRRLRFRQDEAGHAVEKDQAAWRFAVCWFAIIFVFFSLAKTKLPNYVLPCYPPLALLVGGCLERWLREPRENWRFWSRWAFGSLAGVGVAFLVLLPLLLLATSHGEPWLVRLGVQSTLVADLLPVAWVGVPALLGGAACFWLAERGQAERMLAVFSVTAVIFSLSILSGAARHIDRHQTSATLAECLQPNADGTPVPVAAFRLNSPTLVYYANQPVPRISRPHEIVQHLATPGCLLVTTDEGWHQLDEDIRHKLETVRELPRFPIEGKVMVLRRRTEVTATVAEVIH